MAIKVEFVNLIIPIQRINESEYEGGFEELINKYRNLIGRSVWFDKELFRMGWMDTCLIDGEINFWKSNGLKPIEKRDDKEYWCDLFAISTGFNQFMTNCDWIEFDTDKNLVWMKRTNPSDVYPNNDFASYDIL